MPWKQTQKHIINRRKYTIFNRIKEKNVTKDQDGEQQQPPSLFP